MVGSRKESDGEAEVLEAWENAEVRRCGNAESGS